MCFSLCILACGEKAKQDPIRWTTEEREYIISELKRTSAELEGEIHGLTVLQANWAPDGSWSIKEIVAHLEMQNQLHFREINVTSMAPSHPEFAKITDGNDGYFIKYATDPKMGKSKWFLNPVGKYDSLPQAWQGFKIAREELILFVKDTKADLRSKFTYRVPVQEKKLDSIKIGEVRDLHQLLLTGIAHTDRHIQQIRKLKSRPEFPAN